MCVCVICESGVCECTRVRRKVKITARKHQFRNASFTLATYICMWHLCTQACIMRTYHVYIHTYHLTPTHLYVCMYVLINTVRLRRGFPNVGGFPNAQLTTCQFSKYITTDFLSENKCMHTHYLRTLQCRQCQCSFEGSTQPSVWTPPPFKNRLTYLTPASLVRWMS